MNLTLNTSEIFSVKERFTPAPTADKVLLRNSHYDQYTSFPLISVPILLNNPAWFGKLPAFKILVQLVNLVNSFCQTSFNLIFWDIGLVAVIQKLSFLPALSICRQSCFAADQPKLDSLVGTVSMELCSGTCWILTHTLSPKQPTVILENVSVLSRHEAQRAASESGKTTDNPILW